MIDNFEPLLWSYCCSSHDPRPPQPVSAAPGCSGSSMAMDFDLAGINWIVVLRQLASPLDLRNYTHMRFAIRSSSAQAHHDIELKLFDGKGLWVAVLKSVTDLPVWRPVYVDFREFTCGNCAQPLDLSSIQRLEIGIVRCACEVSSGSVEHSDHSILYVDELVAVDLRPGAPNRLVATAFEAIPPTPDLRASTAQALLARQLPHGLLPAWFEETAPHLNTYSQAIAGHVFVDEYLRTRGVSYREAASRLAQRLIGLQIAAGKVNAGAWFTSYDSGLRPFDPSCTGNETSPSDVDRCQWIGNVGWALIFLGRLRAAGFYDNPAELEAAIVAGTDWVVRQRGRNPAYPNLIAEGIEGNLSAYFGLVAGGRRDDADQLGAGIYQWGWDPVQKRMKTGVNHHSTALDTAGSWGADFLRVTGREQDALHSLAYAATLLRTVSFDGQIEAYGDIAGPWTIAVEFTGQAAASGMLEGSRALQRVYPLQAASGAFPGSTDNWYGGTLPPWTTSWTGVAPTAWVYFAQNGNPLLLMFPKVHVDDRTVAEGSVANAAFRVYLSAASDHTVTVDYATMPVTASAGNDYVAGSGTLTFTPGRRFHSVYVPILADGLLEGTETFMLNASNAVGATLADGEATGTIQDAPTRDDLPMYRAYNPNAFYHFFTTSLGEFNNAVAAGYHDESNPPCCSIPFRVPNLQGTGRAAIFRMYNPSNGRHYYTASGGERDSLMGVGWVYEKDEGFIYASQQPSTVEVFKLYNNISGVHLYTVRPEEKDAILAQFPGIWFQHTSLGFAVP